MRIWIASFIVSTVLLVLPNANSAEKTSEVSALTQNELDLRSDELIERVKSEATNGSSSATDAQVDVLADQLLESKIREAEAQSNELPVTESDLQEKPETPASNSVVNSESEEPEGVITDHQNAPEIADGSAGVSDWLAEQPPENVTIQFSASPERALLESFLEKNQLPEPTAIFKFDRNGRSWHALVHGSFSSTREAQAALAKMPQQAKLYNPWFRRFDSIQDISN